MNKKTGIYIVCGGVVCFGSTISWGSSPSANSNIKTLLEELSRVNSYWASHHSDSSKLGQIFLVGNDCQKYEAQISEAVASEGLSVSVSNVWTNAFSLDSYIPPIIRDQSLKYAVSAGLAMDLI